MVSVCLTSDALLQHLQSYLGFSYLARGVCLHGCCSKAQLLLLTLEEGYLLMATPPDLRRAVACLGRALCAVAAAHALCPIAAAHALLCTLLKQP